MKALIWTLLALSLYYCPASGRCQVKTENVQELKQSCDYDDYDNNYCEDRWVDVPVKQDLICSDTSISKVQETTVSEDIKTCIVITESSIQILTPNGQYKWEKVEEFRMLKTNTSEIFPGFFNNFKNLLVLQIVKNNVTELTSGVFSPLSALKTLDLSENLIETVAPHTFSGLSSLQILNLRKNKISVLPPDLFAYQILLSRVDISENKLKNIGNIFSSGKINFLNISHNYLIDINITQFHALKILDCSFNMIENVVANDTYDSSEIEQISISYNKITNLPKIRNVLHFNISYNSIQSIDTNVLGNRTIILDISHNNISNVPSGAFQNLTNLQYLYFDHNNLKSLSVDIFYNLYKLKYLALSSNQIKQIPFGCFNDLGNLTYLDLSNNNMNIHFHIFSTLKSLNTLKFHNNNVDSFDLKTLLLHLKKLKSITLNDNSWNCSQLASVIQQLQLNDISFMRGRNTNVSNILGISCTDDTFLKEDRILIKRINEEDNNNKEIVYSVTPENIDNIVRNTTFFRYLETIAEYISKHPLNETNLFESKNFTNTTFFKVIENFATNTSNSLRDILSNGTGFMENMNESLSNSTNKLEAILFRIYNGNEKAANETQKLIVEQNDILKQILAKNASNINISPKQDDNLSNLTQLLLLNLKSTPVAEIKQVESNALIREKHDDDGYKTFNNMYLIINNILLVIIVCCLVLLAYCKYFRPKLMPNNAHHEQVQLM